MRKYHLTLSAKNINFTDVLPGNCGSYIVQTPLAIIYISMAFWGDTSALWNFGLQTSPYEITKRLY
ncbi:hypothetical protein ES703_71002 [subsurface metagenome]